MLKIRLYDSLVKLTYPFFKIAAAAILGET